MYVKFPKQSKPRPQRRRARKHGSKRDDYRQLRALKRLEAQP